MIQFYRVKGADFLKEIMDLANSGRHTEASELSKRAAEELNQCSVKDAELIRIIVKDVVDAGQRASTQLEWQRGGYAQTISLANGHIAQKAQANTMYYMNNVQSAFGEQAASFFGKQKP